MAPPNTKPLAPLIVVIGALIAISLVFSPRTNLANKYLFTQSQTSEEQAPQQPNQSFANTESKAEFIEHARFKAQLKSNK